MIEPRLFSWRAICTGVFIESHIIAEFKSTFAAILTFLPFHYKVWLN